MKNAIAFAVLMFAIALFPGRVGAQAQDYRSIYEVLTAKHAAAVVTVKFVMSVTSSGKE